jgi:hypothetical protein
MTITYIVEIIPTELTLRIKDSVIDIAVVMIHINNLENTISIIKKAASLQSTL